MYAIRPSLPRLKLSSEVDHGVKRSRLKAYSRIAVGLVM